MKCLMFGLACDEEQFDKYIKATPNPYSVAHYLFEFKLIEELEKSFTIEHNYILQKKNRQLKNSFIKASKRNITKKTHTKYLSFLNLPIINFLTIFFSTFFRIVMTALKSKEEFWVLSTINYFPVALGTICATKLMKRKNVIIFTDCSVGYAYDKVEENFIKKQIKRVYKGIISTLEQNYDGYILFSPAMNELVNKKNKPWCVMEGFFNQNGIDLNRVKRFDKFILLYAGTIIETLGLQELVEAFKMIDKDMELWIYGEGDYKEELMRRSEGDSRIKFFGFVNRAELFEIEKKVSLLVNVRDPKLAYTKYSFPSKSFEYLASATPFLSTRLMCYPKEYEKYIFFIEDNSPETIANKIVSIYKIDRDERVDFGIKAQEFILKYKNSEKQVDKIKEFIEREII